ncbi:MAG TPA: protein kinase, partial [Aquabacterium sp.]|nr:protein kinase [Aquabacterium sp.]
MSNNVSSTPDALPVGTRLMDYDIEGLLGVGGFGLVYRAREAALQRVVAIKEFLPSSLAARGSDGSVVLRAPQHGEAFALGLRSFVNEARLLARFDHPALVRVIRFWEDRGTAYMVMPCYEGQTLYEARRDLSGPPDEAWLRALMEPLLGALDCLHREQVYHRDVAPDNILILKDPDAPCGIRPVLLDFGAARRVLGDHTQALTAILKPSFAPIEQYAETSQLRQGPWTDLYGLAAVLHYCVTGRTPVPATARAVHDDLPS